jgi:Recombination endonuclease VII
VRSYVGHREVDAKKARSKDLALQKKYGITLDQYNAMFVAQDESCAFCHKHASNFKNSLHVDHDHKTKQVRKLLCHVCNRRYVRRHNLETATKLYRYMLLCYNQEEV